MEIQTMFFAFGLTLAAGLATGLGGLIALFSKRTNRKFLSVSLGFSAGVMIYVSMMELLVEARERLIAEMGEGRGALYVAVAFFSGIAIIALLDHLVPEDSNPHHLAGEENIDADISQTKDYADLRRAGIMTALAVGLHSLPEGFATFTAALTDPTLGVAIAIAIFLHNIPAGISVAVPVYYACGSRKKAFYVALLCGLTEPLGACLGYFILMPYYSLALMGVMFAAVSGMMIYISLDELLPAAEKYGEHHLCIGGVIAGMAFMAITLLLTH